MEQRYPASLSITSWVISIAVMLFTVGVTLFLITNPDESESPGWAIWSFPLIMGSVTVGLFLYRPLGYSLTPYSFVIRRMAKDVVIDKNDIELMRTVSKEEMGLPIRTFGNGGFFGFTGSYFSDRLGKMTWYATRTENYVLVQLKNGKKVVVTPDDPGSLVGGLAQRR